MKVKGAKRTRNRLVLTVNRIYAVQNESIKRKIKSNKELKLIL